MAKKDKGVADEASSVATSALPVDAAPSDAGPGGPTAVGYVPAAVAAPTETDPEPETVHAELNAELKELQGERQWLDINVTEPFTTSLYGSQKRLEGHVRLNLLDISKSELDELSAAKLRGFFTEL